MIQRYIQYIFLVLVSLILVSCNFKNHTEITSETDKNPKITSNFWEISKKGEPTSYLIGSMHFGKPEDVLPNYIDNVLQQVDYVYTEVKFPEDPTNPTEPDFIQFMQKMYDTESGKTLSDKIGQERFDKIKKLFIELMSKKENFSIDVEKLNYLQPWILPIYLPQVLIERKFSTATGIDYLAINRAKELNKPLAGLEDHMFRYYILKEKPMNLVLSDIDQVINNEVMAELSFSSMYTIYHSGSNFDALAVALDPKKNVMSVFQSKEAIESANWLNNELLQKRNLHWLPTILAVLPKQKNLFIVGLLHLYGLTGMVQKLRENGYTVTPIPLNQ